MVIAQPPLTLKQSLIYLALGAAVLVLLRWADTSLPMLGLWLFIVLSLSLGMGHGALDAVLLLAQFKPYRRVAAYAFLYLLLVLGAGVLLALSPGWALLALLAMSVWHFGELYHPSLANRLMVGGASVMAPMLLSSAAMAAVLQPALGANYSVAWTAWYGLALIWAAGAAAWVLWACGQRLSGQYLSGLSGLSGLRGRFIASTEQGNATARAALELAMVLALNAVLSPLMAFAVYFGLWHSGSHVVRVLRALARHSGHAPLAMLPLNRLVLALALTGLATAVLLWLLWRWLLPGQGATGLSTMVNADTQAFWVQWLIVALAAVTLPHMLLVAYSHRWLGR